jgi:hypothetical protein
MTRVLRDLLAHVHGSTSLHDLETRTRKVIFRTPIRGRSRSLVMIRNWTAQRSRLAFCSCLLRVTIYHAMHDLFIITK